MGKHRTPYVGEGADGARRSAEIDRSEADQYDRHSDDWYRCIDSAEAWDRQADEIQAQSKRTYIVDFSTTISLSVHVEADDENDASEAAHDLAEDYLQTLRGDTERGGIGVFSVDGTLDGQAEDSIAEAGTDAAGGRT